MEARTTWGTIAIFTLYHLYKSINTGSKTKSFGDCLSNGSYKKNPTNKLLAYPLKVVILEIIPHPIIERKINEFANHGVALNRCCVPLSPNIDFHIKSCHLLKYSSVVSNMQCFISISI